MRVARAIDRFLQQMRLERDWTPRTIDSVYRTLILLADEQPEARLSDFDGRAGTDLLREHIGRHFGHLSANTRKTRISYHHTFWAWAEEEGFIDDDPARRIKRPPSRRADVYRPTPAELDLFERACTLRELGAWALMGRRGLRSSTVVAVRWQDIDLARGRVRIQVKGGHRDWTPLGPAATAILRHVYRQLAPEPDDHVFTVEQERWADQEHRVRTVRDPKTPATTKTLWRMVGRVCRRAGIRPLGPHALRHGFATGFLRRSERDTASLKRLLGHSRIDTTELYTDELDLEELEDALERADTGLVTSVAGEGNEEPTPGGDPGKPAYGGGGNRTRVRTSSPDDADGPRIPGDDDPRLEPPDGRHK